MRTITESSIAAFEQQLIIEEKSAATVEKYLRDIRAFAGWLCGKETEKARVLEYKAYIVERYASASVNSMLSSLNSFFEYSEWYDCKVKTLKIQRQIFASSGRMLTKQEYSKLLAAALGKGNERLYYVMQTICSCGLRVSELQYVTVEAVNARSAKVNSKGKVRIVFLPKALCRTLHVYIRKHQIKSGPVFVTKSGKPLNRSNIWAAMKKLCAEAGVSCLKVFPHNLRHLFARTYYSIQKDIVRLADILGHSNINTTRIYTMETGEEHRRQIERLGLLRC